MSANLAGKHETAKWVNKALTSRKIDFAGFQEIRIDLAEKFKPKGWKLHCQTGLCFTSKHPFENIKINKTNFPVSLYKIEIKGRSEYLINVHLETPRKAFTNFSLATPFDSFKENVNKRYHEAKQVKLLIEKYKPAFVVGDFNMPVESAIYKENFSTLTNAFDVSGVGFGHTKFTSLHGVRIDHILTSKMYFPLKTWVHFDVGSDHNPIISNILIR